MEYLVQLGICYINRKRTSEERIDSLISPRDQNNLLDCVNIFSKNAEIGLVSG